MTAKTVANSVLQAIGNTPLVKLSNINRHLGLPPTVSIYAKLEHLSVGGSKKDRVAKQIVMDAIDEGKLRPGQRIVELTSGNTGTGLAIVSACLGYPFTAVMSRGNSQEREKMMTSLGATVVLVDQHKDSTPGHVTGADLELVEAETQRIVDAEDAFRANQFSLPGSYRAHYLHTGPECWEQSLNRIDCFVDFVGTGGTFVGISKFLKEQRTDVKCFIVEPTACSVLDPSSGVPSTNDGKHRIQGGGYSKSFNDLPLFDEQVCGVDHHALVDGYWSITDEEAIQAARLLAQTEGIFGGFSAGANVAAASKVLLAGQGKNVLAIVCDSGLKYLSTDLYPR